MTMIENRTATGMEGMKGIGNDGARRPAVGGLVSSEVRLLGEAGRVVLRYGLVALLLLWGSFKFAAFEAEAIKPLIENSPLLSWMHPLLGVRGASAFIGVVELVAAALICTRSFRPFLSAVGSLIAAGTFLTTLSLLLTTPGALSPVSPIGGFLLKDIILLGAALYTAAEALEASQPVAAVART
jgi:reactive chlorine resistance protein C